MYTGQQRYRRFSSRATACVVHTAKHHPMCWAVHRGACCASSGQQCQRGMRRPHLLLVHAHVHRQTAHVHDFQWRLRRHALLLARRRDGARCEKAGALGACCVRMRTGVSHLGLRHQRVLVPFKLPCARRTTLDSHWQLVGHNDQPAAWHVAARHQCDPSSPQAPPYS